jgi:hypothetical protein
VTKKTFPRKCWTTGNSRIKNATDIATQEIFWEIFGRFSGIRPWARGAIIVCLFLSIAAFVVIVAQYLYAMVHYIF